MTTTIYVASDAIQRMAGIEFFTDTALVLHKIWRIIKRIGRIIAFILAMMFGAAVPTSILIFILWVYAGPH